MGAPDRMLHPLVAPAATPLPAPAAQNRVGSSEGEERFGPLSAAEWKALREWLPTIPLPERLEPLRNRWRHGIDEILATELIFDRLSGGRWRVGQGVTSGVYGNAPEALAIAYDAVQVGEAPFTGISDDAMRNRLHLGLANWAERVKAPLLAERFRRLKVQAGRVIDPYAKYTYATRAA